MRRVGEIRSWIEAFEAVDAATQEVALAYDFYKEEAIEEQDVDDAYARAIKLVEDLELRNMLSAEEDRLGAVLKINAGAGGTESQDWASMLVRMYQRWAERSGYKVTITNWQDGDAPAPCRRAASAGGAEHSHDCPSVSASQCFRSRSPPSRPCRGRCTGSAVGRRSRPY